jgi:UDP-galactopyranose mutase
VHHVEIEGRRPQVVTADFKMSADLVIVTGPIDVIFGFCYGPLEWRGNRVEVETVPRRGQRFEILRHVRGDWSE